MTETATYEHADHVFPRDELEEINEDTAAQQEHQDVVDDENDQPVHRATLCLPGG